MLTLGVIYYYILYIILLYYIHIIHILLLYYYILYSYSSSVLFSSPQSIFSSFPHLLLFPIFSSILFLLLIPLLLQSSPSHTLLLLFLFLPSIPSQYSFLFSSFPSQYSFYTCRYLHILIYIIRYSSSSFILYLSVLPYTYLYSLTQE